MGREAVDLHAVAAVAESIEVDAGDVLIREGDDADAVFFVVDGELAVSGNGPEGPVVLAKIGRGGIVGEGCLLSPGPATATVSAPAGAQVLRLGREDFDMLSVADPAGSLGILRTIVATIAARLDEATRQLDAADVARISAARVALHA